MHTFHHLTDTILQPIFEEQLYYFFTWLNVWNVTKLGYIFWHDRLWQLLKPWNTCDIKLYLLTINIALYVLTSLALKHVHQNCLNHHPLCLQTVVFLMAILFYWNHTCVHCLSYLAFEAFWGSTMSFGLARSYVFLVYFQFIYLQCVFFVESYIYCLRCVLCVFYSNWISLLLFIPKLDACFCSLRFLNKGSQLFHIKMESHIVKQFYKVIKATNSIQCKCYINNTASLRLWMNCIPSCWP